MRISTNHNLDVRVLQMVLQRVKERQKVLKMNVMTCANQNSRDDYSQSHTGQIQFRWLQQPWPRDADSSWHAFQRSALPSSRLTGLPLTTTPRSDIQTEDDCQEPASRQNSLAVTFGGTDWRSGRKMSVCQRSAATTKSNAFPRRSFCTHFPFLQLENWSFLHFYTHQSACWISFGSPPT